jgi:outer membrane protein OmpA-like peptidoglycan-associated protein
MTFNGSMWQKSTLGQRWYVAAALLALTAWPLGAAAQVLPMPSTPSAAQMVDQLKAPPRTRSLAGMVGGGEGGATRNLTIEAQQADTGVGANSTTNATGNAAPVRPSLSLQIQFDFNSAKVRAESQQALSNLAQALRSPELQSASFAVEGHTDAKGRADYNQKLSQSRAEAVREYLAQQGVESTRLQASGKGSSDLANSTDPYAAENRRVRIVNLN